MKPLMIRRAHTSIEAQRLLCGRTTTDACDDGRCLKCNSVQDPIPQAAGIAFMWNYGLCVECFNKYSRLDELPEIDVAVTSSTYVECEAVAVTSEWDGFTLLNAYGQRGFERDELRKFAELAESTKEIIRLPDNANCQRTIFIVPIAKLPDGHGKAESELLMLKLLEMVCGEGSNISSLLVTHADSGHTTLNALQLRALILAIPLWAFFKGFRDLKLIQIPKRDSRH